jgi:hypothetical protein
MDDTAECYWECDNCLTDYDPDQGGGYCECGGWLEWVDESDWLD